MPLRLKLLDPARLLDDRLTEHIKDRTERLGRSFERIKEARVTVDPPRPKGGKGRFRVRITLGLPDAEIAVDRQTGADLPMAVRESFDAADQRLEDYVRTRKDASAKGSRRSKRKR